MLSDLSLAVLNLCELIYMSNFSLSFVNHIKPSSIIWILGLINSTNVIPTRYRGYIKQNKNSSLEFIVQEDSSMN